MLMRNYYPYKKLFGLGYMYFDIMIDDHFLGDSIFYKNKIPVKFGETMTSDKYKYCVVFCSIKKKYKEQMEESFKELRHKMDLLGYLDYEDFCNEMLTVLGANDDVTTNNI